jgi:arginine-tRNA-protein transferase
MPCPYLKDRAERRVVTELAAADAERAYETLSRAGFRRSHGFAYAPACPECNSCVPVRVRAPEFKRSRSQRRVWNLNADLLAETLTPVATTEQFALFTAYQTSRHGDGDMARMEFFDYQALVEDTPVPTDIIEFREPEGRLLGVSLLDRLADGYSAVYSVFDPKEYRRSLGRYMILWSIEEARKLGLPYVYLGFWIAESSKMAYKSSFRPLEAHDACGWRTIENTDEFTQLEPVS